MIYWIKLNFTKHEIWTLRWAQKLPILVLFLFGALYFVWFFVPVLVLVAVFILIVLVFPNFLVFVNAWLFVFAGVGALVAMAFFLIVAPWFFRWYFIAVGLMFGRTKMATNKMEELQRRLAELTASE